MIRRKNRRSIANRPAQEISARARVSRRNLQYQSLERREVLSAVSFVEGGTVTVEAGDEPNQIVAYANKEENLLVIEVDELVLTFPDDQIRQIHIFGNGGDDSIGIRDSVTQTTLLDGGDGRDTIIGSQQHDVIVGGPGNDRLSGRGGADRIDGGAGNDAIAGGDGDDGIQGGIGSDNIRGGAGNDTILGDPSVSVTPDDVEPDVVSLGDATASRR